MQMSKKQGLHLFRKDLRLHDNPSLNFLLASDLSVATVFLWSEQEFGEWVPGAASRWWLHHSLEALSQQLEEKGGKLLIVRTDDTARAAVELAAILKAENVSWNRRYEPALVEQDKKLKTALEKAQVPAHSWNSHLIYEPWDVANKEGRPYRVFTPFKKMAYLTKDPAADTKLETKKGEFSGSPDIIQKLKTLKHAKLCNLDELEFLPQIQWDDGFQDHEPGELGAQKRWKSFLKSGLGDYKKDRDFPSLDSTSFLSPSLAWGEISPRQMFRESLKDQSTDAEHFRSEIMWREFAYHMIYHFPKTTNRPLQERYEKFPWEKAGEEFDLWKKGQTGFPIVDAGMRQLWETGWMHNRVRMIVASFLVKDLRISWLEGARWFWDTLVDADLASNTLGWQWAGGCGADAAPYFRVFNPRLQSEKFDKSGKYIKRFIPELSKVDSKNIHAPEEVPILSADYPPPIVDHKIARDKALAAFQSFKEQTSS